MKRRLAALFLLAFGLAAGGAGVATTAEQPEVAASAYGITIVVPGQPGSFVVPVGGSGAETAAAADSYAYPADGSIVRSGALSSSVSVQSATPQAQAVNDVLGVVLFNGEITFDSAAARAKTAATTDTLGSAVTNLVVSGQSVAAAPNQRFALGDWGFLVTLEGGTEETETEGLRETRAAVTAVHVTLTAEHAGLPAGTEILIGHAEASMAVPVVEPPATTVPVVTAPAKPSPPTSTSQEKRRPSPPAKRRRAPGPEFRTPPTDLSVSLSPRGYVFPIYGATSFISTWGAPRATTGRHQGTDIFAPLGAPVLAVASGTLFSVGWNRIGGWRLWLRDQSGNEFYYAHMAAYAPVAANGARVRAGQVIAFNGNSGDAQGTPFHVHFEFHPVALLPLGYEGGAVDPVPYLTAWRRVIDIVFPPGRGWAPPVPANAKAPRPGAFLLGSTDISSASGLEPGALERALAAPVNAKGDGALRSG